MELPFAPTSLVPLVCAWRTTPPKLPRIERAKLAFDTLRRACIVEFDTPDSVARAIEHLGVADVDVDVPFKAPQTLVPPGPCRSALCFYGKRRV